MHPQHSTFPEIANACHACRHIGVKEIQLYVLDSEPKPQDEELKNYSKAFLHWRSLSGQRPNEDEATFVRRKCIEENSQDTAFITFLHTYDYIMPRGRNKNDRKQLLKILETREFRFGAGEPHVVYMPA